MQARAVFLFLSFRISLTLAQTPPGQLHIYHFEAGNGDATLVVTPGNHTLLIDGGRPGDGRAKVIPRLEALNIKKLDYIVATHFDPDHTGGLQEVWENIPMSGNGAAYDRHRAWPNFVAGQNQKPTPLLPDSILKFDEPDLKVTCVAVNGKVSGGIHAKALAENDENARSIALTIEYRQFRYFIGGDLTGEVENLVAYNTGKVAVLRVNHHGSQTSSTKKFLDALAPKVAIISAGTGGTNKDLYHFPSGEVLQRLLDMKGLEKIYMTTAGEAIGAPAVKDRIEVANGDIEIATDGQTIFKVNGKEFALDQKKQ